MGQNNQLDSIIIRENKKKPSANFGERRGWFRVSSPLLDSISDDWWLMDFMSNFLAVRA